MFNIFNMLIGLPRGLAEPSWILAGGPKSSHLVKHVGPSARPPGGQQTSFGFSRPPRGVGQYCKHVEHVVPPTTPLETPARPSVGFSRPPPGVAQWGPIAGFRALLAAGALKRTSAVLGPIGPEDPNSLQSSPPNPTNREQHCEQNESFPRRRSLPPLRWAKPRLGVK